MTQRFEAVPLADVLSPVSRPTSVDPATAYSLLGTRLYAQGLFVKEIKRGTDISADRLFAVRDGDFVYNRLFGWKGTFALAGAEHDGCYVSGEFPCFRVAEDRMDRRYLLLYFTQEKVWREALDLSSGSTQESRNRLKAEQLLSMRIPLPPLHEQQRIVDRIQAIAVRVEEAQLLREEARQDAAALSASGADAVFEIALRDVETSSVAEIADVRGGIQKCSARIPVSNPRRYLTVAHVQRDSIDFGDPRHFEVADYEIGKWRLLEGDLLVVEGNGSEDQIGRTALFRGEIEDCVHQNHLIRVRPDRDTVVPEFLNAYLNAPRGQAEMRERSRTSSGLFNLSVGRIKSIQVPIPPLEAQDRIVQRIEVIRDRTATLGDWQTRCANQLNALMPAVLDQAFKGEL